MTITGRQDLQLPSIARWERGPHGRIKSFRWIERDQMANPARMALLEMEQTSESTVALIHAHNAPLRDRQLKVSFSKSSIDADGPLPE